MAIFDRRLIFLVFLFANVACQTAPGKKLAAGVAVRPLLTEISESFQPLRVNQIAIYPLEAEYGRSGLDFDQQLLTGRLAHAFERETSLEIYNLDFPAKVEQAFSLQQPANKPLSDRVRSFGRELGVQGVLYGVLSRYEDLVGTRYGGESSGSVGLTLRLVAPQSGEVLWVARYHNSNQPLSENLFRVPDALAHGVAYKERRDLLERGFVEAARSLEKLRTAAGSKS